MTLCGCRRCYDERASGKSWAVLFDPAFGFRYACEVCGNKRCPHHADHNLACTGSNAVEQPKP
jgi:hypothetical protein